MRPFDYAWTLLKASVVKARKKDPSEPRPTFDPESGAAVPNTPPAFQREGGEENISDYAFCSKCQRGMTQEEWENRKTPGVDAVCDSCIAGSRIQDQTGEAHQAGLLDFDETGLPEEYRYP